MAISTGTYGDRYVDLQIQVRASFVFHLCCICTTCTNICIICIPFLHSASCRTFACEFTDKGQPAVSFPNLTNKEKENETRHQRESKDDRTDVRRPSARHQPHAPCLRHGASHWCRKMMLMAIHRGRTAMSLQDETFLEQEDDEDLLRTGQQQRIEDALKCLLPKEQQIVRQFYGIDCKRLSLTEIATEMGFSKARASTLHLRALRKLEAALREHPLVDYLTPWLE